MPSELIGVVVGGGIGLVGALGGVLATQLLTNRREARSRAFEGLHMVVKELNNRNRLALQIEQIINIGLRTANASKLSAEIFDVPGWKELTHELQERSWLFPCTAYLPEALDDFLALDSQIHGLMNPYLKDGRNNPYMIDRKEVIHELGCLIQKIHERVGIRLKALR